MDHQLQGGNLDIQASLPEPLLVSSKYYSKADCSFQGDANFFDILYNGNYYQWGWYYTHSEIFIGAGDNFYSGMSPKATSVLSHMCQRNTTHSSYHIVEGFTKLTKATLYKQYLNSGHKNYRSIFIYSNPDFPRNYRAKIDPIAGTNSIFNASLGIMTK